MAAPAGAANLPPGQTENWVWTDDSYVDGYPAACANVLFIGARGSGEGIDSDGFGGMVRAVRDGLRASMPAGLTVRQVGVAYPALDTQVLGEDLGNLQTTYFDGMLDGVQRVWNVMQDSVDRCPDEVIVLAGYSQGAGVMHRVLVDFPSSSKVKAAVLIADPGRESGYAPGTNHGSPRRQVGLLPAVGLSLDPIADIYRPRVIEYCKTFDPICDTGNANELAYNPGGLAARVHNDIHIHGEYKQESLRQTGRTIAAAFRKAIPPAPLVLGNPFPGSTLTANTSHWIKGTEPLTYQWYRDNHAIPGATGRTYRTSWNDVFPAQDGRGSATRITVRVTAPSSPYSYKTATSRGMYFGTPKPSISGSLKIGETLTAKVTTWPPAPYVYQYQWYRALPSDPRSRQPISGATGRTYTLTSDDAGVTLQVVTTLEVPHDNWPQWFESASDMTGAVSP